MSNRLDPMLRTEEEEAAHAAHSLHHHKRTFYVAVTPNAKPTRIYYTRDIRGPWKHRVLSDSAVDSGLFFDDDGTPYLFTSGGWDGHVSLETLGPDLDPGVATRQLVYARGIEGSNALKINGWYDLFNALPVRLALMCSRAHRLDGPWETIQVLDDRMGGHQWAIVDLPDGRWYGFVMRDSGPIGRVTIICPITWQDVWPPVRRAGSARWRDVPSAGRIGRWLAPDPRQGRSAGREAARGARTHASRVAADHGHVPLGRRIRRQVTRPRLDGPASPVGGMVDARPGIGHPAPDVEACAVDLADGGRLVALPPAAALLVHGPNGIPSRGGDRRLRLRPDRVQGREPSRLSRHASPARRGSGNRHARQDRTRRETHAVSSDGLWAERILIHRARGRATRSRFHDPFSCKGSPP